MQIVINISNSTFTDLKKKKNRTEVDVAVLNGTPLPKGHGRLIDADALLKKHPEFDTYPFPSTAIDNAPPIIEADKECEDKDCYGAKDVEVYNMAIKALEKDIPKAPKKSDMPRYGMGYEYYDWYCPTCNKFLAFECDTKRQYIHHCECGQRLNWGKA